MTELLVTLTCFATGAILVALTSPKPFICYQGARTA
jgi:uncharacterized membrane protein YccC